MNRTKRAIITGASRGLGRALARGLADEGWDLIVIARNEEALSELASEVAPTVDVIGVAGDIRAQQTHRHLADAARRLGGIDLLVNNAGGLGPAPLPGLIDYDVDALEELFGLNVVAQLAVVQAVSEHLVDDATIMMISSDAAVNAYPGWGGYGATKAALDHLAAVLAVEHEHWRVLSVDPGDMRTAMHRAAFPGEDISDRPAPDEVAVPGLLRLLDARFESGRYAAGDVVGGGR